VTTSSPSRRRPVAVARTAVRRAAKDPSSLLLMCQLIAAGAAFVVNILAARALQPSGRGELALMLQLAYMSSLGLLLGCDRSIVAVYSASPVRLVTRSFVRLLTAPSAVGLAVLVAVLMVPLPGDGSWRTGLALTVLFAVANAFVRAVRSIAIAAGRQRDFLGYSLACESLRLVCIGLLFVSGTTSSTTWMLAYVFVGILPTAVWLTRWAMRATPGSATAPVGALRATRREGLQLLPSTMANSGMLRLDRLLVAALASTTALGMYATVATMTELLAWPLMAFADSRLGVWREAHDRGTLAVRRILGGVVAYCAVASCLLALALHVVLVPLLGPDYEPAKQLLIPLVAASAVFGTAQIVVNLLIAVRRNSLASAAEVVGFMVSVGAYVVLIGRVGAIGAAYGTLLGYLACLAVAGLILVRVRASASRTTAAPGRSA
jgi:O-antigen/teichoic acid export membrane protein